LQELAFVIAHDMLRVQRKLIGVQPYHTPAGRRFGSGSVSVLDHSE
jgi:hypothetical protein